MTRDELRTLLNSRNDGEFVEREIFGRRPWIFDTDERYRVGEVRLPPSLVWGWIVW